MNHPNKPDSLLAEFPRPSYEEWRREAEASLNGAPFEKKLVTATYEGISLQPIYRMEDAPAGLENFPGFPGYLRGTHAAGYHRELWAVSQELPYGLVEDFNKAAKADLSRGQTGLNILLDIATVSGIDPDQAQVGEVGACGLSISTVRDILTALEGIDLEKVPVRVQAGCGALPVASLLYASLRRKGKTPALLRGGIEMDPLAVLARAGRLPVSLDGAYREMAVLASWNARNAPSFGAIGVNTQPYADAGASSAEELGCALATATEYLRQMKTRGLDVEAVAPLMRFSMAIGPQFFMEVAKFRAARLLWARVVEAFGGSKRARKLHVHGRTGTFNKTVLDPYVNMLRSSIEAFAGVVGGVDSMHVGPFDECIREPDDFSRRIARNTHVILSEECHVGQVADPAGGSWFVENLTEQLAAKAWKIFQDIEKAGGMAAALAAGTVQKMVADTAAKRISAVGQRRDVVIGTNMYPNLGEKALEKNAVDYASVHRRRAHQLQDYRVSADQVADRAVLSRLGNVLDADPETVLPALIEAAGAGATLGEISRALRSKDGLKPTATPVCCQRISQGYERLRAASEAYKAKTGKRPTIFLATMGSLKQHKARADFSRGFFSAGGFDSVYPKGFANAEDAAKAALESGCPIVVICSTDETYPELVPAVTKALKASKPQVKVILAGAPAPEHEAAYKAAGLDDSISIRTNNFTFNQTLLNQLGVL